MNGGWIALIVIGALLILAIAAVYPELRRYMHIRKM